MVPSGQVYLFVTGTSRGVWAVHNCLPSDSASITTTLMVSIVIVCTVLKVRADGAT